MVDQSLGVRSAILQPISTNLAQTQRAIVGRVTLLVRIAATREGAGIPKSRQGVQKTSPNNSKGRWRIGASPGPDVDWGMWERGNITS